MALCSAAQARRLTAGQEYGECMADTPPGMKINFDEQNMTKWEVLMDGPEQSAYAVCVFADKQPPCIREHRPLTTE